MNGNSQGGGGGGRVGDWHPEEGSRLLALPRFDTKRNRHGIDTSTC